MAEEGDAVFGNAIGAIIADSANGLDDTVDALAVDAALLNGIDARLVDTEAKISTGPRSRGYVSRSGSPTMGRDAPPRCHTAGVG